MKGIEKITERITADTKQEIENIRAASQQECGAIQEEYDKLQQEKYWEIINQGTKAAEQRVSRLDTVAAMEAKKQLLALKQATVAAAFDLAITKLSKLPEDKYVALLAGFAKEGSRTGEEQLFFSHADRSRYGKKVCKAANELLQAEGRPGNLSMSEETRVMRGGLILSDGNIDINYNLESLVAAHKNELMEQVAKILFD